MLVCTASDKNNQKESKRISIKNENLFSCTVLKGFSGVRGFSSRQRTLLCDREVDFVGVSKILCWS